MSGRSIWGGKPASRMSKTKKSPTQVSFPCNARTIPGTNIRQYIKVLPEKEKKSLFIQQCVLLIKKIFQLEVLICMHNIWRHVVNFLLQLIQLEWFMHNKKKSKFKNNLVHPASTCSKNWKLYAVHQKKRARERFHFSYCEICF